MIIGIDLGTTFSAAAYVDNNGIAQIITNRDGQRTTPSVVAFSKTGERKKQKYTSVCNFSRKYNWLLLFDTRSEEKS